MLLYLLGNGKSDLLDFLETGNIELESSSLVVKKLVGKFSLRQFVVKDMRNYPSYKYFVIEVGCIDEEIEDFILALQSFQMMFSARIIVIMSGSNDMEIYIKKLIEIGVTDIVTTENVDDFRTEMLECLTIEGMQRFKQEVISPKEELSPEASLKGEIETIFIPKYILA